jgi:hypothetical protein
MVNLTDALYVVTLKDHNLSSTIGVVTCDGRQEPSSAIVMANEGNKLHARRRMPQRPRRTKIFWKRPPDWLTNDREIATSRRFL